ncbi:MAG TPA: ATP phosphoribosyltransferase regulatory subunit [Thermoanaerobaculia bacterium]|nr:ATP phosphoribosyltransferase regulatory subunit [Thermoanaerobaculia bacterium]
MAAKLRYPTGVRPLLIEETARRRRVEARFVAALERAGFAEVVLPIIDYADPYAPFLDRNTTKQSYRFVDREGDLVGIRSDFTPMLARALAPSMTADELPLRIFYRGDVIRFEASRLGANRELFQIGAEIVGDGSVDADVEMLRLAAELVRDSGARPTIVYNDTSIVTTLGSKAVRAALVAKRMNDGVPDDRRDVVAKLIGGQATIDDVAPFAAEAAGRLRAIADALPGDDFVLHLDDVDEEPGYYTGIRFRVYANGGRRKVAQGGRYDNLYARFGTAAAAIGFTFTIDDLD